VIIIDHGTIFFDGLLSDVVDRYADFKLIRIHFEGKFDSGPGRFESYGEVVENEPATVTLKVKRERVIPVCKAVLDELPVSDIDIQEAPIEDIVRRLFAESGARAN
jgi:ABC-2 type transport system ATP-binding protein